MARWQLLAGPAVNAPTTDLTTARGRKATFKLTEPSSLAFTVDGRHPQAAEVQELAADVHLLRDGVPLYTGRTGATGDDLDDTGHTLDAATADTRALLGRRLWHTEPYTDYTAAEQTTVAAALLNHTQAQPGGGLGISTAGLPTTGGLITRRVEAGATILGELTAIAAAGVPTTAGRPGFDWDISPGWSGRTLQIWHPQRGQDRGVVLDYIHTGRPRASIVAKLGRNVDPATYAGAARVSGAEGVTPQWVTAAGVATAAQGLWEAAAGYTDVATTAELTAKAARLLAELGDVVPTYSVTLRRNAWEGPDHIWLGDTVRLLVRSGRIGEDVPLRVLGLELGLGESGEEDVSLTLGAPAGSVLRRLHDMERRLTTLERH